MIPPTKGRERYVDKLLNKLHSAIQKTKDLAEYLIQNNLIEPDEIPLNSFNQKYHSIFQNPKSSETASPISESKSSKTLTNKKQRLGDFSMKKIDFSVSEKNLSQARMKTYYEKRIKADFVPLPSEKKKLELDLIKERLQESQKRKSSVARITLGFKAT